MPRDIQLAGVVFAINGDIRVADLFGNPLLFGKLQNKLLTAYVEQSGKRSHLWYEGLIRPLHLAARIVLALVALVLLTYLGQSIRGRPVRGDRTIVPRLRDLVRDAPASDAFKLKLISVIQEMEPEPESQ